MFNLQFEEPYLSQAQAIMRRLCIKVDGDGDPKTYNVMKSFLNSAKEASKGGTAIFNTDFGAETVTESYMPHYQNEQQTSLYTTSLLADNKALMLTTKDGAVFCCALVRVGDQDYLSIMNPQTAMEIRDAFAAKGYDFLVESPSNQQFPILPDDVLERLSKDFRFSVWKKVDPTHTAVRFCTSWATSEDAVKILLEAI